MVLNERKSIFGSHSIKICIFWKGILKKRIFEKTALIFNTLQNCYLFVTFAAVKKL